MSRTQTTAGVAFPLLGVPVTIEWTFLLLVGILTIGTGLTIEQIAAVGGVVVVSILWHELGHAVAFGAFGHRSRITIHMLGGTTSMVEPVKLRPGRDIVVTLAGPAAGLALAGAVWAVDGAVAPSGPVAGLAVRVALFVNFVWSLANLLPMLPLDGGRVMAAVLDKVTGGRGLAPAAAISIAVGAAAAAALWRTGWGITALLAGYLALTNVATLRSARAEGAATGRGPVARGYEALADGDHGRALRIGRKHLAGARSGEARAASGLLVVYAYLLGGRPDQASLVMQTYLGRSLPGRVLDDRAVRAAGGRAGAVDLFRRAYEHGPTDIAASFYAQALIEAGRADDALNLVRGGVEESAGRTALVVLRHLVESRRRADADEVAATYLTDAGDPAAGVVVASLWAQAGERDLALEWLRRAADAGFDDRDALDRSDAFESLRGGRDFEALRARLRPSQGAGAR